MESWTSVDQFYLVLIAIFVVRKLKIGVPLTSLVVSLFVTVLVECLWSVQPTLFILRQSLFC